MPDDTVHILDPAALPADQMMMVVTDPCFIERGGVCGFDATYQPHFQQGMKVIINGLTGKAAEALAGNLGNGVGVEMSAAVDRRQHRETGRSDSHPHRLQLRLEHFCID